MNDYDNPALYDVAKSICLRMGMPWTDPRTGETFQPKKKKKRRRKNVSTSKTVSR